MWEAGLCRELGMELVVTDHHECKAELPEAVAVVDPHRPDQPGPVPELAGGRGLHAGVRHRGRGGWRRADGAAALLREYCDLLCLGQWRDVMPLTGENRTDGRRGLKSLENPKRVGVAALMAECGGGTREDHGGDHRLYAGAADQRRRAYGPGRCRDGAVFDGGRAAGCGIGGGALPDERKRQEIEAGIYREAVGCSPAAGRPDAIVLASERWHQGVVGIVASRLAEEYSCPTFLICLDGDKGKASSRSHGGFNLFAALQDALAAAGELRRARAGCRLYHPARKY